MNDHPDSNKNDPAQKETQSPSGVETKNGETKDSFGIPVKKSPLFIYALLQIPLVIIMAIILYFMYQSRS